MRKISSGEKGFTLIEIIVTLVLVGITTALAGMWIVSIANGYIFTKMNASTTQKAQLAMTRLEKEFSAIMTVVATTADTNDKKITYTRTNVGLGSVTVTVTWVGSGNPLQLTVTDGTSTGIQTLTDNVSTFALSYCNDDATDLGAQTCGTTWTDKSRIIDITLTLTGANNTTSTFTQRVAPRNF